MRQLFYFILALIIFSGCGSGKMEESNELPVVPSTNEEKQKEIIDEHLRNGAWKESLYSREWQEEIDKGLAKDSTIAYLWQQKAMPLFKQGKYEKGMEYIDKAVTYDANNWLDYRAFIKCIFAKNYQSAIDDFELCKEKFGNSYVMDHSYEFYIALSLLQLNEFEKAEEILVKDIDELRTSKGESWVHHLDLFYLGISHYEQRDYVKAVEIFDLALEKYPEFSDVQYYKASCLYKLGQEDGYESLIDSAKMNADKGYTINEDNAIYERYPYQVRWN